MSQKVGWWHEGEGVSSAHPPPHTMAVTARSGGGTLQVGARPFPEQRAGKSLKEHQVGLRNAATTQGKNKQRKVGTGETEPTRGGGGSVGGGTRVAGEGIPLS